jgi:DNA-binding GntR family transcriptional regulator
MQIEKTLSERVTTLVREAILQAEFRPGERINQDELAARFGISRMPIRDAVMRLAAEGLVEVLPHRGAFVTSLSPQSVRDIFGVRLLLEPEVVRQAARALPDAVIGELEAKLETTVADLRAGEYAGFFANDVEFHETLVTFASNKVLSAALQGINNRVILLRRYASQKPGSHMVESLGEHGRILVAIRARDPEAAADLMCQHIRNSIDRVLKLVSFFDAALSGEEARHR